MSADIAECRPLPQHRLWLRFKNGAEGIADVSHLVGRGVFAPWADPGYFEQVRIDPDAGTVSWPNGADLDPYVLYSRVTGTPLPGADAPTPATV